MEDSILTSTKKILGIAKEYTAFDQDIITHINSVFDVLGQLGIGNHFAIEDEASKWEEFGTGPGMNMVKSYVFLKVRLLFDPPSTSFHISAMEQQIKEYEWRLSTNREVLINPVDPLTGELFEEVIP